MANRKTPNTSSKPFLERWARFSHRRKWFVIGGWVVVLIGLIFAANTMGGAYDNSFKLPGSESQAGFDLLAERFPARSGDSADVVFEAPGGIRQPDIQARIEKLLADAQALPGVVAVESPFGQQPGMISQDGTIARASVIFDKRANEVDLEVAKELVTLVDAAAGNGLRTETGGDIIFMTEQPEFGSEAIGLLAAMVILFIAFGSLIAMGLPIGAALFGIGSAFAVIALAANSLSFPEWTGAVVGMIGIGVGVDYALLVVTRFREGLHHGRTVEDAVVLAVTTAGRSVIFAGVVVTIAFFGLYAMGIPFLAAAGTSAAISVAIAVLVSLFLMPAMLSMVGKRVDSLKVPFLHSTEGVDPKSGWYRMAKAIQRRPLPYALAAVAVLLTIASPTLAMDLGFTDAGNGREELHTRRAYDLLAKGFGPGYNGPLMVVVENGAGVQGDATRIQESIAKGEGAIAGDVAFVSSPILNPDGDTAIVIVYPSTSPQDPGTKQLVHDLRDDVLPPLVKGTNTQALVAGGNAAFIDIGDQIGSRMPLLFVGVIGLSFILLMTVFRSVLVALKAAIMNLLSISAAYGVLVAIFQFGWGANLLGIEKGPIEVFLPMMMFAILFGLSMDYEVFLISRIREEYVRTGDNATAVAHGLAATARVITAAAAIMIAVFLAFVLGPERFVKEMGIGLATAIFVDATIVRLVLVPATMELLGNANWWLPGWLDRLLPHLNVEGVSDHNMPQVAGSPAGGAK